MLRDLCSLLRAFLIEPFEMLGQVAIFLIQLLVMALAVVLTLALIGAAL